MIRKIRLKNFKSFADVEFDLTKKRTEIKPLVLIYGENGSGKSNIIESIAFLKDLQYTMKMSLARSELLKKAPGIEELSEAMSKTVFPYDLKDLIFRGKTSLPELLEKTKTIGSKENMFVEIEMYIEDFITVYALEFDNVSIVKETIRYPLNERIVTIADINKDKIKIHKSVFGDKKYEKEFRYTLSQYWGKHTFLSTLAHEIDLKNETFIENSISEKLIKVINYIDNITVELSDNIVENMSVINMISGRCKKDNFDLEYKKYESSYNSLFKALYADIYKVYYETSEVNEDILEYKMHFEKNIGDRIVKIPADLESMGTKKIIDLMPYLLKAISGGVVWFDEFDLGIHDVLISTIIRAVANKIQGQLVITTHNTTLIEPDAIHEIGTEAVYILDSDYMANKKFHCLSDYNIKKTNNPRDMYLRGAFGGISFVDKLYIDDIFDMEIENLGGDDY